MKLMHIINKNKSKNYILTKRMENQKMTYTNYNK